MDIILEHVADAIITIDVRGVLQGVNRAAENLFGWDRSEMLGRPVAMLMDPAISTLHQNFVQRYVATGVSGVLNHRPRPLPALHKSGAAFNVEMTIAEADLDGSPVFIGVCRQISASSAN
jgi:PAS domain S-box-containing protein